MKSKSGILIKIAKSESDASLKVGSEISVSVRPESIMMENAKIEKSDNIFKGTIINKTFLGSFYDYRVKIQDEILRVQTTSHKEFDIDSDVWIYIDPFFCKCINE